jgi:serine protease Do
MFPKLPFDEDFHFEFPERPERQQGIGSGVIVDASGLIITNSHVVAGGRDAQVLVRLSDGREYVADEVWADAETDIAVVKILGADDLVPAQLADSDQVAVGDWVLALGQPFGLERTVTAGIISATHRGVGINARENFLQTDAAINPGNSGGPLVNLDGQIVGINTAISSRGGGNDGVGFAVPINVAKWVADQLATEGHVRRAYLGIGIQPIDADIARQFGVKPRGGVLVTEVYADTPAAKSGLKSGDVIVKYAGVAISSPQELQMVAERSKLGERHELTVVRDGERITLTLVPKEQPEKFGARPVTSEQREPRSESPSSSAFAEYGLEIGELDADVAERLGIEDDGVLITSVEDGGPGQRAGLEAGMVIVEMNRHAVTSVEDGIRTLGGLEEGSELLLRIKSAHGSHYVVLKP